MLKAYVGGIGVGAGTPIPGTAYQAYATAMSMVFDGAAPALAPDGTPIAQSTNAVFFTNTATYASIKAGVESDIVSSFNAVTGRIDGITIQFVWLDDRGLL